MCGVKPKTRGGRKCPVVLGETSPSHPRNLYKLWGDIDPGDSQCPQINMNHQTSCRHLPSLQSPPSLGKILKIFIVFVIDHNLHNIWGESIFKKTAVQSDNHEGESPKKIILRDRNVSLTFIWSVRGNFHTTSQCVLTTLTSRMMNSTPAWSLFYKHPSQ